MKERQPCQLLLEGRFRAKDREGAGHTVGGQIIPHAQPADLDAERVSQISCHGIEDIWMNFILQLKRILFMNLL